MTLTFCDELSFTSFQSLPKVQSFVISIQFLSINFNISLLFLFFLFLILLLFVNNIFSATENGTNQRWAPLKSSNSLNFSSKSRFLCKSTQNSSGVGPDDAVIIVDHGSRRKESNLMLSKNRLLKLVICNWECFSFDVENVVLFLNFR